jgi:hypothetical protein
MRFYPGKLGFLHDAVYVDIVEVVGGACNDSLIVLACKTRKTATKVCSHQTGNAVGQRPIIMVCDSLNRLRVAHASESIEANLDPFPFGEVKLWPSNNPTTEIDQY